MKKWVKISCISIFLLAIAMVMFWGESKDVVARQGVLSLASPAKVKMDDKFDVKVTVKSDIALAAVDAIITYDASVLEFIGNVDGKMTGSSGVITLTDLYETETKEKAYKLEFRAITVGDAKFAFGETYVTDYADLQPIEMYCNTDVTAVVENKRLSENAELKDMLVATGTLSPAFSGDIVEYSADVDADCDSFIFSSIPADENATIVVDKPDVLMHGANVITITVTAPAGNTRVYTIKVIRK